MILILFPGQSDLAAYPLTEKGIKAALAEGTEFRIEYFIEYMDRYRNSDQNHHSSIFNCYSIWFHTSGATGLKKRPD